MAYSLDFRKRVLEFIERGNTWKSAQEIFKVSSSVINRWFHLRKETGELKDKKPNKEFKKIDPEKLKEYIEEKPDAYLREVAHHFNCSVNAIFKRFRNLKFTLKKTVDL